MTTVAPASAPTALVILPTLNEAENLPLLVPRILEHEGIRLLIIDDRSADGTGAVAEELAAQYPGRIEVMHRTGKRGLGLSYAEAFPKAAEIDVDVVCQMDADLSHDPVDVPRLLAASANADLVIGSRYMPGGRTDNWPRRRVLLSKFANRYVRTVTGLRISDCTSGFRCWRRETLQQLPLQRICSNGYAFQVEMAWEAASANFRVIEVPITFVERRRGASKLSGRVVIESALAPWRLVARRRLSASRQA